MQERTARPSLRRVGSPKTTLFVTVACANQGQLTLTIKTTLYSLSLFLSLSPSLRVKYAPEIMLYYGLLSIWGPYRELFFLGWDILTIPRAFNPFFHQNWDCHPQSRWRRSGVAPGWAAIKIIKARVSDAWVNSGSRPL